MSILGSVEDMEEAQKVKADVIKPIDLADVYPDDWREQGWCCRECGILAWYSTSPELRRELHPARNKP
jgi:hypothetical protein